MIGLLILLLGLLRLTRGQTDVSTFLNPGGSRYHKDDIFHRDIDLMLGNSARDQAFVSFNDGTATPQHQMDSANPTWTGTLSFLSAPSNPSPTFSKTFKKQLSSSTASEVYVVSIFDSKTLKVVAVSYTQGNPSPYSAFVAVDTSIDSSPTVVPLDVTHHNGEIFLLCKTSTPGTYKVKKYTLPTVPNTMVSVPSEYTVSLASTWATNPIDDDLASLRVGKVNPTDVYLTAIIFNRITAAVYLTTPTTRYSRTLYFYSGFLDTSSTTYIVSLHTFASIVTTYPSPLYIMDMAFFLGPNKEYRQYVFVVYSSTMEYVFWLNKGTDSNTYTPNSDIKVTLSYNYAFYYGEFSQNIPAIRGIQKPSTTFINTLLHNFVITTGVADTVTPTFPNSFYNYEGQTTPPKFEECDGYINVNNYPVRFCSNYYENTFETRPQSVVDGTFFEGATTNYYRLARIQKFGKLQGAFMAFPLASEPNPVMMGIFLERSFVYIYQLDGQGSTTTKKKEFILIKPSRYSPTTGTTPNVIATRNLGGVNLTTFTYNPGMSFTSGGSAYNLPSPAPILRFSVTGLLDYLSLSSSGLGVFPWKIAAPLNKFIPLVLDRTKTMGNNFKWSLGLNNVDATIERLIFKDNLAFMEITNIPSNTAVSLASLEIYPTGSLIWTKNGNNVTAYTCDHWRAEEKPISATSTTEGLFGIIKFNCTYRGSVISAGGTYFKHFKYHDTTGSIVLKNGNDYQIITSKVGSNFVRALTITYTLVDMYPYGDSTNTRSFLGILYTNTSATTANWVSVIELLNDGNAISTTVLEPSSASILENPKQILLMTSPSTIYLLDFKGVHYRVTIQVSSLSSLGNLVFSPSQAIIFNRPDLEIGSTLLTLRGCLFPSMMFLYYLTGSATARLSTPLNGTTSTDLSSYSLALNELGFTIITGLSCTHWSSTFAVMGKNSMSNSLVAVYDAPNFANMDKRLKAFATIKSTLATSPPLTVYPDKGFWFITGAVGTTGYIRILNESVAALLVKPVSDPISFTVYLNNGVAPQVSFAITGKTYTAPAASNGSIAVMSKPTNDSRQTQMLKLEDLLTFNNHVLTIDMQAALAQDQNMVSFTPRINFERLLNFNQFVTSRVLQENRRVLQTSTTDAVAPTQIKTRDGITIVMFDWGSPAKTRLVVYSNTDTNAKTLDTVLHSSDSTVTCSGFDFKYQASLMTIHLFYVCSDTNVRYSQIPLDSSIPVTVYKRASTTAFNTALTGNPKISIAGHINYDNFLVAIYTEVATEGVLLFGLKLSDSATSTGLGPLSTWTSTSWKQLSGTANSQPKIVSNFVELNFGTSLLGCIATTDTNSGTIQYKVYCMDTQMTQTSTVLPTTSYATVSLVNFQKAPSSIVALSCVKASNNTNETVIFCDAITYDSYIYESRIKVNLDLAGIRVDKETTGIDVVNIYERYGDTIGWTLASNSEYIAVTGQSYLERFNRVMLYKRISAGGSKYTNYSVDIQASMGLLREGATIPISMYYHPVDNVTRLLIYDYSLRYYAKIYKITSQTIELAGTSLYEQLRLQNMDFLVNKNLSTVFHTSMFNVLFSSTAPNRDVRDIGDSNWFLDNLVWIMLGFLVLLIIFSPVFVYYFRRERLKKFNNGGN